MSNAPPARATRATAFGTERVYPPGADYMVAPPDRHMRLARLFRRLENAWDCAIVLPLLVGCMGLAFWGETNARPVLTWVTHLAVAGVLAETLATRLLWGKCAFRVLSHYYRHWLEPADSPRFCRIAVVSHPLAVATILSSFLVAWAGCVAVVAGLRVWSDGHAEEGVALAVFGGWAVFVSVWLASGHRRAT